MGETWPYTQLIMLLQSYDAKRGSSYNYDDYN